MGVFSLFCSVKPTRVLCNKFLILRSKTLESKFFFFSFTLDDVYVGFLPSDLRLSDSFQGVRTRQ